MNVNYYISSPFNSNMYVIPVNGTKDVILIDPGEVEGQKLNDFLQENEYNPRIIILTHEHFDHCAGINELNKHYNFEIYASEVTAHAIKTSKGNLSKYATDYCEEFAIENTVHIVHDAQQLKVGNISLTFMLTPGHSKGGICVLADDYLFSGDTLLETKVPLKLPGSNRTDWEKSIQKLKEICNESTIVYPGHGSSFSFK